MRLILIAITFFVFSLSSCIKDEGVYREADIESFTISSDIMLTSTIVNQKDNNRVIITVDDTTGMKNAKITPDIKLSPGAKIEPASGVEVQLQNYQTSYIVTAGDGNKKSYTIILEKDRPLKYNFENWYQVSNTTGTRIYDMLSDELWCNANKGVAMIYRDNTPFPTRRTTDSHNGEYGILLETVFGNRNTILHMLDIPLYAGSAFRGVFETNMSNPVTSVKFGQIHSKSAGKPIRFTGWYKYKPGEYYQTCTVNDTPKYNIVDTIPGKKDELDIYAVMFKVPQGNEGKNVYLTANDVLSSNRLVATAIISDKTEKNDWTRFDIPFIYTEEIDYSRFDYKLAIVLSSSKRGAFYEGAIGSLLVVDEIEIVTEPIN
ncbi:PCMD domain-containing protein [Dysgonomonas reticulitermitis]